MPGGMRFRSRCCRGVDLVDTNAASKKAYILVVEDNEIEREGLAVLLRREGYAAQLAATPEQALDFLKAGTMPNLVLLDMQLPVGGGERFLQTFQQISPVPAIPVVMATLPELSRQWAREHGALGYIAKPIECSELLAEARRC